MKTAQKDSTVLIRRCKECRTVAEELALYSPFVFLAVFWQILVKL